MDFVVDSEEFKNAEVFLNKSYEDFKDDLDYWRTQIDQLKTIWSGEDADVFYRNMEEYMLKLDMLCETKHAFSKSFKYGYLAYEEKDEEFAKELKKENSQYDDEKFVALRKQQEIIKEQVTN